MPTKVQTKETPKVNLPSPKIDEKALIRQESDLSTQINEIKITDQDTFNAASLLRPKAKQYLSFLEGIFAPQKTAIKLAKKVIEDEEKKYVGPRITHAKQLIDSLNSKIGRYILDEESRKRREAEEQRKENERLAAIEKKKLEKQAEKAEEKGQDAKADILREKAAAVAPPPVSVQKAVSFSGTGLSGRDDIAVEILDTRLFLKYLLDSGADVASMIEWKYKPVKDYVKGLEVMEGEEVQKAPGITVTKKKIIAG